MLEFHGYARLKFTIETDEIKFQKLVALLKAILKAQKCPSKPKQEPSHLDETQNAEIQRLAFYQRVMLNPVAIDFKFDDEA